MFKKYKDFYPIVDNATFIADSAVIIGKVSIGKDCSIWDCSVIRGDVDEIRIGNRTNIQDGSILHVNQGIPLIIGNDVTVGHAVNLHGCTIGNDTLIGIGAIILNGAVVGNKCIVGAGALVTQNTIIPDNSLVLGSPAKVIRQLTPEEIDGSLLNADNYVKLSKEYM